MRGDRPMYKKKGRRKERFTPHARGSTELLAKAQEEAEVYPACAGIDRPDPSEVVKTVCLPRMRGDRPREFPFPQIPQKFTPHARGSTNSSSLNVSSASVYPACAGIDLTLARFL